MKRNRFLPFAALAILFGSCQKNFRSSSNDLQELSSRSAITGESQDEISGQGMVYTLSNQADGNEVITYRRDVSGQLTFLQAYPTGGKGTGSGLGSQGAVILSGDKEWLLAVNPGGNSVTSFKVTGDELQWVSTLSSGGTLPISVTEHNGIVFVLNAGGNGNISGFKLDGSGHLSAIPQSERPLSTTSATPAQISFTASGNAVVVTEKANNRIITYTVNDQGIPGAMHSVASSTPTPFGFAVSNNGYIYVSEAVNGAPGLSTVSSYYVANDGTITLIDGSIGAGQTAACWVVITNNGKYAYATNTGSGSVSSFKISQGGNFIVQNAVAGATGAGSTPIDAALSNNSKFLYALNSGNQTISAFAIANDGSLGDLQVVTGLPVGSVGLAAK